ncbi:hypothetical protein CDFC105_72920 [Clostridioides difficile]|nr:hypothetical protein [Clostridioides difficile]MDV9712589.1 hypothetical protein [Clostridioides difficile]CZR99314.1 hypothetical protein CDFC105_64140 [Clostridioides difficile]CZS08814.1 hypothetical protein CDFC105_72920 [Clostridioides difficile]
MIKNAMEYLVKLGKRETVCVDNFNYTTDRLEIIEEPGAKELGITTLSGLVDYIKSGIDHKEDKLLLIQIVSPQRVLLRSALRKNRDRETYIMCEAWLPEVRFDRPLSLEAFNIMLQSAFIKNNDRDILLRIAGNVQESTVKTVVDDGVSQVVSMKTGIATVSDVIIPNTAKLKPFRTFSEVEQPESEFVFRLIQGEMKAMLCEADGGAWKNQAMLNIKAYLQEELKEFKNVNIIA